MSPLAIFRLPRAAKASIVRVGLTSLAVAFEVASKLIPELQRELADWSEGRRISLGALPDGPSVTIEKRGGQIHYLGPGHRDPDISLLFKNLDSALLMLTGQIGSHQAAVENRVCVHGSNHHAVQVTRCMSIVQLYLLPEFMLRDSFKRMPQLSGKQRWLKAQMAFKLAPSMLKVAIG